MKDKWILLDIVMPLMYLGAVIFAITLVITVWVLALMVKPVKLLYKALAFVLSRPWHWIRSPLSEQG
jgi:hypothetical protein